MCCQQYSMQTAYIYKNIKCVNTPPLFDLLLQKNKRKKYNRTYRKNVIYYYYIYFDRIFSKLHIVLQSSLRLTELKLFRHMSFIIQGQVRISQIFIITILKSASVKTDQCFDLKYTFSYLNFFFLIRRNEFTHFLKSSEQLLFLGFEVLEFLAMTSYF